MRNKNTPPLMLCAANNFVEVDFFLQKRGKAKSAKWSPLFGEKLFFQSPSNFIYKYIYLNQRPINKLFSLLYLGPI